MKRFLLFIFLVISAVAHSQNQVVELCEDSLKTFTYFAPGTPDCEYNWSVYLGGSVVKLYQGEKLQLTYQKSGDYRLEVYSENELCESETEEYSIQVIECRLPAVYIPNAFTPNSDGLNDIWIPKYSWIAKFNLQIYNRWGQLIFETNQFDRGWDGTFCGMASPMGAYIYTIEYTTVKGSKGLKTGDLILYR